jgi:salicylate hydroxylase
VTPRAIVVGGGIGGLSAALALAAEGFSVTVLEQSSALGDVGAGIQLSPNATRVLHHLGLEAPLRGIAFLPEGTEMRSWRRGHVIATAPLGEAVRGRYGHPYYHVHRADLVGVLAQAASEHPAIRLLTGARVASVAVDEARATVQSGGQAHEAELLVGADGIHSVVRAQLFGAQAPRFTGNVAWRGLIPAARLPAGLVRPMATAWWGPQRARQLRVRGREGGLGARILDRARRSGRVAPRLRRLASRCAGADRRHGPAGLLQVGAVRP